MSTLDNHTLLYDADCPLCRVYTSAFVKYGWLDKDGRHAFQQLPEAWQRSIDEQRAQSEIALLHRKSGRVYYGVDALLLIAGCRLPVLRPLFRAAWFRWLMRYVYAFISYNRKVIAAVKPSGHQSCTPAYHAGYRLAYIAFAWFFTAWILNSYAVTLASFIPAGSFYREWLVCGGQLLFQGILITIIKPEKRMDYFGNMMTVSVIGALLLLPAPGLHAAWPACPALFFVLWFLLVAGIMLLEHARRAHLLGLGWGMSLGWVVYRLLVLVLINQ